MHKNKKYWVGIDVGAVSINLAVSSKKKVEYRETRRVHGRPVQVAKELLNKIAKEYGKDNKIVFTGASGKACALKFNTGFINEFQAITLASKFHYPEVRSILEIGGQSSKYIELDGSGIKDYGVNGECAAGTGSFIDQQANRLHYKVEEIGEIALAAEKAAKIAGRCSVFAKSDMIHAQQRGYNPSEVLRGLCNAVARNFKSAIVKGRKIKAPVLFIGGIAKNKGMVEGIKEAFTLKDSEIIVPKEPDMLGAIGASIHAKTLKKDEKTTNLASDSLDDFDFSQDRLNKKNVRFLRKKVKKVEINKGEKLNVYIGLDVGSVSTNVVLLNENGNVVHEIYTRTKARPIEVITECLREVEEEFGKYINVKGVGTTGSGRELIGELVGADTIKDEITAHKTGAVHIAKTLLNEQVDTIFEIGGQDSKFISIEKGVVVDFTMNEACAAGTGSFLEEQAEKLGISIKDEFANLALSSKKPIKLGERCTVFMERDVDSYQAKGSRVEDIVAGLSYSVVLNYLNRVVRGRHIGKHIFFQGGTAYNDAVAAAFSEVLKKKITVPPHNGVIGAVGAALLAKDKIRATSNRQQATSFKGFNIDNIDYSIREFTCKACSNECEVQEFTVDGSKTYWGDKCSAKYRKKAKVEKTPILSDLFKERDKLLHFAPHAGKTTNPTIGIPRTMYTFDRLPFWQTYFEGIGFNVVLSDETNKKIVDIGLISRVSEPCHPIGVAHGHVQNLIDKKVDHVWLPNILTGEEFDNPLIRPYVCPWGMTLPYMVAAAPAFEGHKNKFITPTLHHMHGHEFLSKQLLKEFKRFGIKKAVHQKAFDDAIKVQKEFWTNLKTLGEMALHKLDETGRDAVVLVGRPYNLYDQHLNLSVPTKLRNTYGVDVIGIDMLPFEKTNIDDVAPYMFWNYGRKILSAAKFMSNRNNLHMIYITNFKCGPDSFIKHFVKEAYGKPFLTLQFDEHSNDAGVMTRIEAYLDSKGLLRTTDVIASDFKERNNLVRTNR